MIRGSNPLSFSRLLIAMSASPVRSACSTQRIVGLQQELERVGHDAELIPDVEEIREHELGEFVLVRMCVRVCAATLLGHVERAIHRIDCEALPTGLETLFQGNDHVPEVLVGLRPLEPRRVDDEGVVVVVRGGPAEASPGVTGDLTIQPLGVVILVLLQERTELRPNPVDAELVDRPVEELLLEERKLGELIG